MVNRAWIENHDFVFQDSRATWTYEESKIWSPGSQHSIPVTVTVTRVTNPAKISGNGNFIGQITGTENWNPYGP